MKLTDFLNSINHTKEDLFKDDSEHAAKAYQPFVVNRSLSYFPDTIFHSNEMNMLHGIDEKMQYDYLKYSVRKRKRFSKWVKSEKIDSIDLIKDYFGYSNSKAQESLRVLTDEQISSIRQEMDIGGVK
tara:strand:+ start:1241 stop:1624 length:384 start_codon:yes stop_codon:yes gene_type:complete